VAEDGKPDDTTIVHADFEEDVRRQLLWWIAENDVKISAEADLRDVCEAFLHLADKVPDPRPRQVHVSRKLQTRVSLLAADLQTALNHVTSMLKTGADLRPILSTRATEPDDWDKLLSQWAVHHLHLRAPLNSSGDLTPRRGELLFAMFKGDDVFLIDVMNHRSFLKLELLEVLRANWPHLVEIESALLPGNLLTETERAAVRKKNGNEVVTFRDGAVALPPGSGTMASGLPVDVIVSSARLLYWVRETQAGCLRNSSKIRLVVRVQTGKDVAELRLHLNVGSRVVVETTSGYAFPAGSW
jgi:hypothetical protein